MLVLAVIRALRAFAPARECVRESVREREASMRERECVFVCERERVCERDRERVCESVCVSGRESERERERVCA